VAISALSLSPYGNRIPEGVLACLHI
jgi:hypothetical protein